MGDPLSTTWWSLYDMCGAQALTHDHDISSRCICLCSQHVQRLMCTKKRRFEKDLSGCGELSARKLFQSERKKHMRIFKSCGNHVVEADIPRHFFVHYCAHLTCAWSVTHAVGSELPLLVRALLRGCDEAPQERLVPERPET